MGHYVFPVHPFPQDAFPCDHTHVQHDPVMALTILENSADLPAYLLQTPPYLFPVSSSEQDIKFIRRFSAEEFILLYASSSARFTSQSSRFAISFPNISFDKF